MLTKFNYLGSFASDEGSKPETVTRIVDITSTKTGTKLKISCNYHYHNMSNCSKIRLMTNGLFLRACESWTQTNDIGRRVGVLEMRRFRKPLSIMHKDQITNEAVKFRIHRAVRLYTELLTMVKQRKLKWYGYITRLSGYSKGFMMKMKGCWRRVRQRKRWDKK